MFSALLNVTTVMIGTVQLGCFNRTWNPAAGMSVSNISAISRAPVVDAGDVTHHRLSDVRSRMCDVQTAWLRTRVS